MLELADQYLQSWSYWDVASGGVFWDNEGNPLLDRVKVFTRPYPPATAGTPLRLYFDPATRVAEYEFMPDASIDAPTVLYVPDLVYDEGFDIDVEEGITWETIDEQTVHVTVDKSITDSVLITIRPIVK